MGIRKYKEMKEEMTRQEVTGTDKRYRDIETQDTGHKILGIQGNRTQRDTKRSLSTDGKRGIGHMDTG